MASIKVAGESLYVNDDLLAQAEALGLSNSYIRTRLLNDWTVYEAYTVPKGIRLEDYREAQKIEYLQSNKRKTREKIKEMKHRDEHPWLYDGTPQVHPRSKYVADLMENDIFSKVVK